MRRDGSLSLAVSRKDRRRGRERPYLMGQVDVLDSAVDHANAAGCQRRDVLLEDVKGYQRPGQLLDVPRRLYGGRRRHKRHRVGGGVGRRATQLGERFGAGHPCSRHMTTKRRLAASVQGLRRLHNRRGRACAYRRRRRRPRQSGPCSDQFQQAEKPCPFHMDVCLLPRFRSRRAGPLHLFSYFTLIDCSSSSSLSCCFLLPASCFLRTSLDLDLGLVLVLVLVSLLPSHRQSYTSSSSISRQIFWFCKNVRPILPLCYGVYAVRFCLIQPKTWQNYFKFY